PAPAPAAVAISTGVAAGLGVAVVAALPVLAATDVPWVHFGGVWAALAGLATLFAADRRPRRLPVAVGALLAVAMVWLTSQVGAASLLVAVSVALGFTIGDQVVGLSRFSAGSGVASAALLVAAERFVDPLTYWIAAALAVAIFALILVPSTTPTVITRPR